MSRAVGGLRSHSIWMICAASFLLFGTSDRAAAGASESCAAGALTCVSVVGDSSQTSAWLPLTFGQPFKIGDVPAAKRLEARDDRGNALELQVDARSTYADGSLRFAVLSTELAQQAKSVNLFVANGPLAASVAADASRPGPDLRVELDVYQPQISVVTFGDRKGITPGTPFQAGESITLVLGADSEERFSVQVTPPMSGGRLDPYMKIAQAFVALINKQSIKFRAWHNPANDGYEKLWIASKVNDAAFSMRFEYAGTAKLLMANYLERTAPEKFVATLTPSARSKPWLDGPVARERDVLLPLVSQATGKPHPHLVVRARVRQYGKSHTTRCDVAIENDWAFEPGPRNFTYDATITLNGQAVAAHAGVTHFHHARWHEVVWSDRRAEPELQHDIPYFLATGAVPNYDQSIRIAESAIAHDAKRLAAADTGPMGTALVTTYMPTTGGRGDIGPLPRWTAIYLLTMDQRERAVMIANADAGGSVPIHYRDRATDLPVSIDAHPTMSFSRLGPIKPEDALPVVVKGDTPWTAQIAHHPSLSYVPYLISGDLFYLDEVMFWGNWVIANGDAYYREGAKGYVWPNELRGAAWSLRTLGEAATALPDGHPMKAYFNAKLQNTLSWYTTAFARAGTTREVSPLGMVEKSDQRGMNGPWQQDFLFLAVAHLTELGTPNTGEFLKWLSKFSVGRWQADSDGYCHQMAPAYYIKIRDPQGRMIATWKDLFAANWPTAATCPATYTFGDPGSSGGYIAGSYAVMGVATDFGFTGAADVQARLKSEVPMMVTKFSEDPTFAIVPRSTLEVATQLRR